MRAQSGSPTAADSSTTVTESERFATAVSVPTRTMLSARGGTMMSGRHIISIAPEWEWERSMPRPAIRCGNMLYLSARLL